MITKPRWRVSGFISTHRAGRSIGLHFDIEVMATTSTAAARSASRSIHKQYPDACKVRVTRTERIGSSALDNLYVID